MMKVSRASVKNLINKKPAIIFKQIHYEKDNAAMVDILVWFVPKPISNAFEKHREKYKDANVKRAKQI